MVCMCDHGHTCVTILAHPNHLYVWEWFHMCEPWFVCVNHGPTCVGMVWMCEPWFVCVGTIWMCEPWFVCVRMVCMCGNGLDV